MKALMRVVSLATPPGSGVSREWAAFVISQFLKVSINQSLWARPCGACSRPVPEGVSLNQAGCPQCQGGRRGRVLVHDTLLLGPEAGELERHELQRALLSGDAKQLGDVLLRPGMQHITRESVVRTLIANKVLAVEDAREFDELAAKVGGAVHA